MNERIPVKTRTPSAGNLPADGGPMQWIRSEIDRLFEDFGRPAPSIFNFGPRSTGLVPALEMTVGEKDGGYYMSERRYGTFTRQIALPTDVDANAIGAKFENGVLQVMLAKDEKAAARSHKIMIEH